MLTEDDWFGAVCESYLNPPVVVDGKERPAFPTDKIQLESTGRSGVDTLEEAFRFYQESAETFRELGTPIAPHHRLLDFGVGWGRIARFFLRDLPVENIHGIDVAEGLIQGCVRTFRSDNFYVTEPFPPTNLGGGAFNFIVGFSVFSHLSEEACARWMDEFTRLLAPGGIVVLTTRGRSFFDFCESLQGKGHGGYLDALSKMFDDFAAARRRYDEGQFVHSNRGGVTGGGALRSDFYGETFIPEAYARSAYSNLFTVEKFLSESDQRTQPIMFFRKV